MGDVCDASHSITVGINSLQKEEKLNERTEAHNLGKWKEQIARYQEKSTDTNGMIKLPTSFVIQPPTCRGRSFKDFFHWSVYDQ